MFKKFNKFIPTGKKTCEKDILEVYLKMQYFAFQKKSSLFKRLTKTVENSIPDILGGTLA